MRLALIVVLMALCACASYRPCADNPRNMSCMTGDQLERELGQ
jgi:hypothetical protein